MREVVFRNVGALVVQEMFERGERTVVIERGVAMRHHQHEGPVGPQDAVGLAEGLEGIRHVLDDV